jgi:hypothetical protein
MVNVSCLTVGEQFSIFQVGCRSQGGTNDSRERSAAQRPGDLVASLRCTSGLYIVRYLPMVAPFFYRIYTSVNVSV